MARSLYCELGPPLGRPLVSPGVERGLLDPEGQRAPPDEGVVVLLPVADAVDGLLRGRGERAWWCGAGSGEGCGSGGSSQYTEVHRPAEPLHATTPLWMSKASGLSWRHLYVASAASLILPRRLFMRINSFLAFWRVAAYM